MGEKIHIKIQQGDNGITYAIKRQIIGYRLFVFLFINIYPLIFTPLYLPHPCLHFPLFGVLSRIREKIKHESTVRKYL